MLLDTPFDPTIAVGEASQTGTIGYEVMKEVQSFPGSVYPAFPNAGIFSAVFEDTGHQLAPIDAAKARTATEAVDVNSLLAGSDGTVALDGLVTLMEAER